MDAGLIGAIAGSIIGLGGGAIGTYFSIKNTNGSLRTSIYDQSFCHRLGRNHRFHCATVDITKAI